jgi:hypothetical protein
MKKLLLILCLMTSSISYAQNNLPPCNGNYWNNCFGEEKYDNGDKYLGQWKDNKKTGQGTYTWGDGSQWKGDKYVGQWKDNKRNGQGTYTYANGDKYVGQYIDDKRSGQGILYNPNGSIKQQGLWRDDNFVQAQTPPTVTPPVVPKPPVNNAQDIKRQKCIRLGLAPGSADFQQCMN